MHRGICLIRRTDLLDSACLASAFGQLPIFTSSSHRSTRSTTMASVQSTAWNRNLGFPRLGLTSSTSRLKHRACQPIHRRALLCQTGWTESPDPEYTRLWAELESVKVRLSRLEQSQHKNPLESTGLQREVRKDCFNSINTPAANLVESQPCSVCFNLSRSRPCSCAAWRCPLETFNIHTNNDYFIHALYDVSVEPVLIGKCCWFAVLK